MNYTQDNINYTVKPTEFSKNSSKEVLQYAVGGLLYMPATNTKIASKIISGEYAFVKSMVLDLEDSLGDDLVDYGIQCIVNILQTLQTAIENQELQFKDIPLIFIRVRAFNQMRNICEQLGSLVALLAGFNIPKFDKTNCKKYIDEFTDILSKYDNSLYIMPIIENKYAFYQQYRMDNLLTVYNELCCLADSVLNIRVGGADFCNIIGVRRNITESIYSIGAINSVLSDIINVFGRSYVVSGPVWEFFENKADLTNRAWYDGLKRELHDDKLNGFIGKTCIHPSQLSVIQHSMIVRPEDYKEAIGILGLNQNTVGVARGAGGNRMNEVKTHSHWAKKIVGLANVYGIASIT